MISEAVEAAVRPKDIAEMCGYAMSEEEIRAACRRHHAMHPLPHMEKGEKRPHYFIRPSQFAKWYEEEERLQTGIA